jgi:hypothetical protein
MEMSTWLWWSLTATLVVVIWISGVLVGHRLGRRAGVAEGYGMCLRDRRATKAAAFTGLYGGPNRRH